METCKTCEYWNKNDDGYGGCVAPNILYGYSYLSTDIPKNGALIENDEGWGIMTGPDFGCVLHKTGCHER